MWDVASTGDLGVGSLGSSFGVRPVINIKSNSLFSGSGTTSYPYIVKVLD